MRKRLLALLLISIFIGFSIQFPTVGASVLVERFEARSFEYETWTDYWDVWGGMWMNETGKVYDGIWSCYLSKLDGNLSQTWEEMVYKNNITEFGYYIKKYTGGTGTIKRYLMVNETWEDMGYIEYSSEYWTYDDMTEDDNFTSLSGESLIQGIFMEISSSACMVDYFTCLSWEHSAAYNIRHIFGLLGLAIMIITPTYTVWEIKKNKNYMALITAFILFAIGYAFVLVWLIP